MQLLYLYMVISVHLKNKFCFKKIHFYYICIKMNHNIISIELFLSKKQVLLGIKVGLIEKKWNFYEKVSKTHKFRNSIS
jgi:hypothetical protein